MIGKKINQLATELAPVSTDLTIIGDPISGVSKKITLAQLGAIFSGAVSFYNDFASFPATGDINVIYCAKDTKKLYLWSGSAYVEVFPSQALLDTYQLRSEKGVSNGYASLDVNGKVPISQLPSSLMEYLGTWNAATNTPTLANGTGDNGDVYLCNAAGTVNFGAGPITFAVGDWVIYNGTIWERSSGSVGTVTSVAATITGDAIGITGSPVTTSGTLAFAFAGTGAQYIKGDGTLATFPNTIAQSERLITEVYNSTGATLTKGTIVYINSGQGNLPTVTKALATGDSTSAQTFGVVQNDITNNNNGYVVVAGKLSDLDTQAYSAGTQLYLSSTTAGTWTSTKQYAPAHLVYVGIVVRAHPTQGVVEIKIQNGYELDELHNVASQTPTNNDGLFWEASTSLWKNKSISTILGGTPITGSGNVNSIPKFTANSVLGNSVMEDDGNFVSMRGLKLNAIAGVPNTINFQQGSGITAAGLGYSTIGASSTTGFIFYIDQNTTSRNFILDTSTITSDAQRTYSMPDTSGTLALVSQLTGGTVTSVGLSSATSGVTIGSSPITTSGTITLAIATASGSQQGLLSSTDWTTFNNKQNALTNPVTGTGTTNYLPKFTGTSTIGNSLVYDNGTNVGIGTATPYSATNYKFLTIDGTNGSGFVTRVSSINSFLAYSNSGGTTLSEQRALPIIFETTGTSRMTLDASGNLGLGVTPSAWSTSFGIKVIDLGSKGTVYASDNDANLSFNQYFDGTNAVYKTTGTASRFALVGNEFQWRQAPSGTAGNAISFTQAMTLDASGRLGIGNTNMSSFDSYGNQLVVGNGSTNQGITIYASTSTESSLYFADGTGAASYRGYIYYRHSNDSMFFGTNAATALTIASTGAATFSSSVTAVGNASTNPAVYFNNSAGASGTAQYYADFGTGSGFTAGRIFRGNGLSGYVANGLNILSYQDFQISANALGGSGGSINLMGGNVGIGTTSPAATLHVKSSSATNIYLESTGSAVYQQFVNSGGSAYIGTSSNDLLFLTNNAGNERIRITSGGQVLINRTSAASSEEVLGIQAKVNTTAFDIQIGTNSYYGIRFRNSSGSQSGYIQVDASSVTYGTGSDYRLKKDLKNFNGLDLLSKIKTYDFAWNIDNSRMYGVIAHELQSVIPYAVSGIKDAYNKDGSINPQGVDYSKIVPVLIKAIQEQQQQIEQLKNK